jgi:chromosome segregation ATPase
MSQKRAVRRDSEGGGASDRQLALRADHERRKLVAAQQVEQLETRLSTLTYAAKRTARENATLTTRIAQLEQNLQEARAAPRFEEADAQAKSAWLSEVTDESSSGFGATLEKVPVHANCTTA